MKKDIEFIAYQGKCFTVEWYVDANGKSAVFDYYAALKTKERIQLLKLVKRMGDVGVIHDKTKFVYEGQKIYAFKPKPNRFLCFFAVDTKIILTNAFLKKQQKLPPAERVRALKIRDDYFRRVDEDNYYG